MLELFGWAALIGAIAVYLAPSPLRPTLTLARVLLGAAGLLLALLAFPLDRALLFGAGFTAAFACAGPLWLAWRHRGAPASAAEEPEHQGQQQA